MTTTAPPKLATIRVTPDGARLLVEIVTTDYRERRELIQAFKFEFPTHCSSYYRPGSRAWSIAAGKRSRLIRFLDLVGVNVVWEGEVE